MDNQMNEMFDAITTMLNAVADNDEIFDAAARGMKKMYDALIKVGFTPEHAILIVAHQGMGFKANQ